MPDSVALESFLPRRQSTGRITGYPDRTGPVRGSVRIADHPSETLFPNLARSFIANRPSANNLFATNALACSRRSRSKVT